MIKLPSKVRYIANKIAQANDNNSVYIVGGAVRDSVLGFEPHDYDFATNLRPDELLSLFPNAKLSNSQGAFPVVLLTMNDGTQSDTFELATYRKDTGNRSGGFEYANSIREDVIRRDFTVNGLALDPFTGKIHDYVGGMNDIANKQIRLIGSSFDRFKEDPLRVLRAFYFASKLNFDFHSSTKVFLVQAVMQNLLQFVSFERIGLELSKILNQPNKGRNLRLMDSYSLFEEILPEFARLKNVNQNPEYHAEGNAFEHSILAVDSLGDSTDTTLNLTVLLHDIGKYSAMFLPENMQNLANTGKITSINHDSIGAEEADVLLRKMSIENREIIVESIARHMSVRDLPKMKKSKQLEYLNHNCFQNLLKQVHADGMGSRNCDENPVMKGFPELLAAYDFHLSQPTEVQKPSLKRDRGLDGNLLMTLGVTPGPNMKVMLAQMEEAYLNNMNLTNQELLGLVKFVS